MTASSCVSLADKRVAFVTAGYSGKKFVYERAKELGVFVVILDSKESWSRSVADDFIEIDLQSPQIIDDCVEQLRSKQIHGICTFSEIALQLTAAIAARLGLAGLPELAVAIARNKHLTRKTLKTVKSALVTSRSEIADALDEVGGFPAVLKPVAGADSLGVRKVHNWEQLQCAYTEICLEFQNLVVTSGALGRKSATEQSSVDAVSAREVISDHLLLEEFLDGPEVDVDIVMDGEVKYCAIADNGPTLEPFFTETWAVGPSLLSAEVQASLESLAVNAIRGLGFSRGVFHVEARVCRGEARLIEVNCRMGGGPIYHMHKMLYGRDLVEDQLRLACGLSVDELHMPDMVKATKKANGGFAYITPTTPYSGRFEGPADFFTQFENRHDVLMVFGYVKPGDWIQGPDRGQPEWIGEIVVWSELGPEYALQRAQTLADELVGRFLTCLNTSI